MLILHWLTAKSTSPKKCHLRPYMKVNQMALFTQVAKTSLTIPKESSASSHKSSTENHCQHSSV